MKPYPEQIEAARLAARLGQGTICMPTGTGKSVTMALLMNELQVKTLLVVPTISLKTQLRQSFTQFFGSLGHITIENIDSAALAHSGNHDCLIIDEAHHAAANTYRRLNQKVWNKIYYKFFFTATPFRSNSEEQMLYESVAGPVIYNLPYPVAVAKGYITPLQVFFYPLPKVRMPNGGDAQFSTVYSHLVVNRADRNEIIADMAHALSERGVSTLVLTKQVEHGEVLRRMISERVGRDVAYMHGENANNRLHLLEFLVEETHLLVGTHGVLGEGIDTKPAEWVILATTVKSKNLFMQMLGRVFRRFTYKDGRPKESGKVVLFFDPSHKFLVDHFKACVNYLKEEYNITPVLF